MNIQEFLCLSVDKTFFVAIYYFTVLMCLKEGTVTWKWLNSYQGTDILSITQLLMYNSAISSKVKDIYLVHMNNILLIVQYFYRSFKQL